MEVRRQGVEVALQLGVIYHDARETYDVNLHVGSLYAVELQLDGVARREDAAENLHLGTLAVGNGRLLLHIFDADSLSLVITLINDVALYA